MSSPILVAAIALPMAVVVAASVMVVWDRRLRAADTRPDSGLSIMDDATPAELVTFVRAIRTDQPTAYRPCWNPAGGGLYVPPWRDPRTARTAAWQLGTGERRVVPRPSWPAWQEPATSWIAEVA